MRPANCFSLRPLPTEEAAPATREEAVWLDCKGSLILLWEQDWLSDADRLLVEETMLQVEQLATWVRSSR